MKQDPTSYGEKYEANQNGYRRNDIGQQSVSSQTDNLNNDPRETKVPFPAVNLTQSWYEQKKDTPPDGPQPITAPSAASVIGQQDLFSCYGPEVAFLGKRAALDARTICLSRRNSKPS
jgi:hypothetical protein